MSRKNRRDKVRHTPTVEHVPETSLVSTFAENIGVELKNTNELMNWIVFGSEQKFYEVTK